MALFITYASFSQAGLKGLLSKPEDRGLVMQGLLNSVGGKVVALYNTTGSNDVVMVSEAPDGSDVVALAMAVMASGAIARAETVRAWTSSDFTTIIEKAAKLTGAYTPPGS